MHSLALTGGLAIPIPRADYPPRRLEKSALSQSKTLKTFLRKKHLRNEAWIIAILTNGNLTRQRLFFPFLAFILRNYTSVLNNIAGGFH
jgi:hypothetical protein